MEFLTDMYFRFSGTFLVEQRWKIFLGGMGMTLILTLASFLLGTALGALFCSLKLSPNKVVRKVTNAVTRFFVQIPTLVLLMVMVYIIFQASSLSTTIIVIIGLIVKCASYMSDIFYSAVTAVSEGEIEAAYCLGMNKAQVFLRIILPQAIQFALPVYKNQFIITLQETSIVGYLAIEDLTRASDIVTARTLDAMFGLLAISALYLLIGWLGRCILDLLGRRNHLGGSVK